MSAAPFRIMGVVNVTPNSFSDGGRFLDANAAVDHALDLAAEGAPSSTASGSGAARRFSAGGGRRW